MPRVQTQGAVCRTCLAPGRLQPIFPLIQGSYDYAELILTYSGVKVEKEDGYPQSMCLACVHLVKSAAFFRKIARNSDDKLRSVVTSSQQDIELEIKSDPDQSSSTSDKDRVKAETGADSADERSADDFADSDSDTSTSENNERFEDAKSEMSEDPEDDKKLIDLVKSKKTTSKRKIKISTRSKLRIKNDYKQSVWRNTVKVVKAEPKIIDKGDKEWSSRVRAIFRVTGGTPLAPLHIECRLCGVTLKQKSSMHVHAQKHLGYRVICEACGKGFPNNCALQQHCMNRHGLKKSFACSRCSFTTSVKFELTVHERTHTGERPFVCDTCGSSFYRRRCLIVHTRSHSDVRPHKCTSCEKCFLSRGDMLAHHNAVHQRRYVFPCPVCGHTYARRTTVYKHVAAQHDLTVDRHRLVKILL